MSINDVLRSPHAWSIAVSIRTATPLRLFIIPHCPKCWYSNIMIIIGSETLILPFHYGRVILKK